MTLQLTLFFLPIFYLVGAQEYDIWSNRNGVVIAPIGTLDEITKDMPSTMIVADQTPTYRSVNTQPRTRRTRTRRAG